jgi:alpha/beta superfamily hydrolase
MARITANAVLPARRQHFSVTTADGETIVGETALPERIAPIATLVCLHPLSTHGGSTDSHLFRKAAWRLPELAGLAVVRFNFRGVSSSVGTSTGSFDATGAEGLDLGAVLSHVAAAELPDPWLLGWSFGTDVALKHGARPPVAGAILLAPTLRWSTDADLDRWASWGKPLSALIPEFDDFLQPPQARLRFARIPQADVIEVPDGRHLFIGERYVKIVLDHVVGQIAPAYSPLPSEWDGPMQTWSVL